MTAGAPTGRPAGEPATTHAKPRRNGVLWATLAALTLAFGAIAGAYLTSRRSTPSQPRSSAIAAGPAQANTAPALQGAFPPEPGPEGTEGQWIGDAASISVVGLKRSWVAFRALSLRGARTLTLTTPQGAHAVTRVGSLPELYVVGPFPEGILALRPSPGSTVASRRDRRRLSVFVSTLRAFPSPVAALPGAGFWPAEQVPGLVFNWLREVGVIDIYSPTSQAGPIWLTFVGRSLGEPRALIVASGATTSQVVVPTSAQFLRLGPFKLAGGRVRVLLRASPGPRRYGIDPRLLSVQVAELAAHTSAADT
jgi:hypothetical protein